MQNSVLHLLTNRHADFGSIIFPKSTVYLPHTEDAIESRLRTFLNLRVGDSPYYLLNVMAAVLTFPEVYAEFNDSGMSFEFSDYTRPVNSISGGASLVNKYGKSCLIARVPKVYPINFEILIKYKDENVLSIVVDDVTYEAIYIIRDEDFLDIDWPAETGVNGILQLDSTWSTSSRIVIFHQPIAYPYKAVAESVLKNTEYISYISSLGILKNMHSAQTDIEKVAVLALAVSNPFKYG